MKQSIPKKNIICSWQSNLLFGILRITFFIILISVLFYASLASGTSVLNAKQKKTCLDMISSKDALLIANPDGNIIMKKNETKSYIPASTLKLITALSAIRHFGQDYRFNTEFYMDRNNNLKIKGYGDPLMISEVWQEISNSLGKKIRDFNNLILDDTFFSQDILIPGLGTSTNPYDAPVGALCANFNTVNFERNKNGDIISAEAVTPMLPFARQQILRHGLKNGRCTIFHDQREAAFYAGELFLHFLREQGVKYRGKIKFGTLKQNDRLIYTYRSSFTLTDILMKMMNFSNNFIANQILITLGAHVYGSPGTLVKGIKVISHYAKDELHLEDTEIVEGSGISRKNRISAMEMLKVLKKFLPYRHLLKKHGPILYKTGTLNGVKTQAGFILNDKDKPYSFIIFLNGTNPDIDSIMECIKKYILDP
ncbi:MAG TPA: D-alanyl-D-alanine carboxypeptidase [Desulfobacteraceae bacterium]|mgnify:CR=1 FL=1|nr:D-alanyl-D-alanine carboxypeptidase [Desulfobacteraceae bacterium]HPQ26995.1 D-alanyl-D-alanine carboxypeptidase [Desulfobacteraceae bacterium]